MVMVEKNSIVMWIVLIFTILFGLYNSFLILDKKTNNEKYNKYWHITGAAIFVYVSILVLVYIGFWSAITSLMLFWVVFGGIVHIVALKKSFFYVGVTAKTDILFRKLFKKNTELWSGIIKLISLAFSLIMSHKYLLW